MNTTIIITLSVIVMITVMILTAIASIRQKKINQEQLKTHSNEDIKEALQSKKVNQKKLSWIIGSAVFLPILSVGIILFFTIGGCSSTVKNPIIILEQEGDKYVFHSDPFILKKNIEKGGFVELNVFSKVTVYPLNDGVYVEPNDLISFIALAINQFETIKHDQGSHNGFVVPLETSYSTLTKEIVPTEKIGETNNQFTLKIEGNNKELLIQWNNGKKIEPILNCEIKSVWEVTNPYPGKTIGNYRDKLLVNASKVINYFNPSAQINMGEDSDLLVIRL